MAIVSLIVTFLAIGLCVLAMLKPRISTLIPAHIMLVLYWFWSFCLIGIGVYDKTAVSLKQILRLLPVVCKSWLGELLKANA